MNKIEMRNNGLLIVIIVASLFLLLGCLQWLNDREINNDKFVILDKAGTSFDCSELIMHSKDVWEMPVYDFQKKSGYVFEQCRPGITRQHKKRCKDASRTSTGEYTSFSDELSCNITRAHKKAPPLKEPYFDGNILNIDGTNYMRTSISFTDPVEIGAIDMKLQEFSYYIAVSQNNHKDYVKFASYKEAFEFKKSLVEFVNQDMKKKTCHRKNNITKLEHSEGAK